MPTSLTKAQLTKKISSDTGFTQKKSSEILTALLNIFTKALARGDSISIRGFGKFYSIKQSKKKIRHPSTGQYILRKQKRIARFKSFKSLRNIINDFEFDLEEFERQNKTILQQLFDLIENTKDYIEEEYIEE
jgi:integration host factor subunit beta